MSILSEKTETDMTPLQRARIIGLLSQMRVNNRDPKNQVIKNVINNLQSLSLQAYREQIVNELEAFKGIRKILEENEEDILNEYLFKQITAKKYMGEISTRELVEWAEITGAMLAAKGLKTNQIRKFLDEVRRIYIEAAKDPPKFRHDDIVLLKVQLAYAKGRNTQVELLMQVLDPCIDRVREKGAEGFEDFKRLAKMVEAIIAYHKFYGGADL